MRYLHHTNIEQDVVTLGEIQRRVKELFPDVQDAAALHLAAGVLAILIWQAGVMVVTYSDDLNGPF
jgi:hypothetical protein